jgi:hypothetical protein
MTSPRVETFELADAPRRARYDALFEACPQAFIQQSTYWAEVIQNLGPDRPVFLLARLGDVDVAGLPLYLYEHPQGNLLTSVPQPGPLGGIFCRADLAVEARTVVYEALLAEALALAEQHACLAATVITNPFADDVALYRRPFAPDYSLENFTQYICLAAPGRRSGGQRNNLTRARKFGFELDAELSARDLDEWYGLHCQRQTEVGGAPLRFELFDNIRRVLLPRQKAIVLLARHAGRIASGFVCIYHQDVLDVFAISMDTAYAAHAPNALIVDALLAESAARGIRIFNWQSSPSRESGVYQHKRQWGSEESSYYFLTHTFCEPARLLALGKDGLRTAYPDHYVVPFGAFDDAFAQRDYRKQ